MELYELAEESDLPASEQILLTRLGLLHDVGKVLVPTSLLNAPRLNEYGRNIIKRHPLYGHLILKDFDAEIAELTLRHHMIQRGGYPGDESLERLDETMFMLLVLFSLIDHAEACLGERPYRPGVLSPQDTIRYLESNILLERTKKRLPEGFTDGLAQRVVEIRLGIDWNFRDPVLNREASLTAFRG